MTDKLRPWTIDFHVAQNDGTGSRSGRTTKPESIARPMIPTENSISSNVLAIGSKDAPERGIEHICWDGCMFPNAMLEMPATWNTILDTMIKVRDAHGGMFEQKAES